MQHWKKQTEKSFLNPENTSILYGFSFRWKGWERRKDGKEKNKSDSQNSWNLGKTK